MSDGFTLHGSPHSLPTYRVALMLRLCRTGFAFRYVSFQRGMHLTREFRALSRWGQVPVLEHKGRVFVQSSAILEYLADTLGCFSAEELEARQHVREWLFWDADRLMPPLYAWYSVELGRRKLLPLSYDPVLVEEFDRKGKAALGVISQQVVHSVRTEEAEVAEALAPWGEPNGRPQECPADTGRSRDDGTPGDRRADPEGRGHGLRGLHQDGQQMGRSLSGRGPGRPHRPQLAAALPLSTDPRSEPRADCRAAPPALDRQADRPGGQRSRRPPSVASSAGSG